MTQIDRTGERCGKLVAIRPVELTSRGWKWLYQCDCGAEATHWPFHAKRTGHCGCLTFARKSKGNSTHGLCGSREWRTWSGMKSRCECPSNICYPRYGASGITVCKEWSESFEAFLADMGTQAPGMTIDRIDNSKGYEPGNCRWATRQEQNSNRRNTVHLTIEGVTKPLAEWARESGNKTGVIHCRVFKYGWNVRRAVFEPTKPKRKNVS